MGPRSPGCWQSSCDDVEVVPGACASTGGGVTCKSVSPGVSEGDAEWTGRQASTRGCCVVPWGCHIKVPWVGGPKTAEISQSQKARCRGHAPSETCRDTLLASGVAAASPTSPPPSSHGRLLPASLSPLTRTPVALPRATVVSSP